MSKSLTQAIFPGLQALAFLCCFLPAMHGRGASYHVSPLGDNNNPGTSTQAWQTLGFAFLQLAPGDTLFVRAGIYSENLLIGLNGDTSNPITIMGYPQENAVIDGTATGGTGLVIAGASYFSLEDLEICNWSNTCIWVENSHHFLMKQLKVHDAYFGIGITQGSRDFVLDSVEIYHFNGYGVDVSPSGGPPCYNGLFRHCIARDCNDSTTNVDGFALGHGSQYQFSFIDCVTHHVYDGFDISARNTVLEACLAHHCWNGGYKLWQDSISLINCIAHDNTVTNAELDWHGAPKRVRLQNCTFFKTQAYNIQVYNPADTLYMYNCILAGGDNIGLLIDGYTGTGNYHGDYNVFQNNNPARTISVGFTLEFSTAQIEAGEWTSFSGEDAHSLVLYQDMDSLFVDASLADFHLHAASVAVNTGTAAGAPAVDFDNVPRPSAAGLDIGAYEWPAGNPGAIGGVLVYDNTLNTPLSMSTIYIFKDDILIDSTLTTSTGHFNFTDLECGTYSLTALPGLPWGGVNATDALFILKHFVGLDTLTGLGALAADTDGNGLVTATDALMAAKRYIGLIGSFPASDWLSETLLLSLLPGGLLECQLKCLCRGDVFRQ